MANSVDPDQTAPEEQSDLGLHCLLNDICPSNFGKFGNHCFSDTHDREKLNLTIIDWYSGTLEFHKASSQGNHEKNPTIGTVGEIWWLKTAYFFAFFIEIESDNY